jgi:predicted DNA-binding protein
MVGDSYSANVEDLERLRALSKKLGIPKAEHIRRAIRAYLNDMDKTSEK